MKSLVDHIEESEKKALLFAVLISNHQDALRRSYQKGKRFHRTRFIVKLQRKMEETEINSN